MKIKEIIVVEGKSDTEAIRRAVQADTIETNGSEIREETMEMIRLAQKKRGVIIFTDPDYPGERIRKLIDQQVPGCKHAFLDKSDAESNRAGESLGIEHASPEAIRQALEDVHETSHVPPKEAVSWQDLLKAGLIGSEQAGRRREKVGRLLKIGYCNGKQFYKRLNRFHISPQRFWEAVARVEQEEKR